MTTIHSSTALPVPRDVQGAHSYSWLLNSTSTVSKTRLTCPASSALEANAVAETPHEIQVLCKPCPNCQSSTHCRHNNNVILSANLSSTATGAHSNSWLPSSSSHKSEQEESYVHQHHPHSKPTYRSSNDQSLETMSELSRPNALSSQQHLSSLRGNSYS